MRRCYLRAEPRGCLRRPRRDRGIASSRRRTVRLRAQCFVRLHGSRTPVALRATYAGPPWILLYPLKRRRSAEGLEAAERCVLAQHSALLQGDGFVALRSVVALRVLRRGLALLFAEQHRAHVLLSYAQKRRRARWPAVVFIRLARRRGLPLPRVSPEAACPRVQ